MGRTKTAGKGSLALGLILAGFVVLAGLFAATLPPSGRLRKEYPRVELRSRHAPPRIVWSASRPPGWISFSALPRHVWGAVVVSEDWGFFSHDGIEWKEIQDAVHDTVVDGKRLRGASTITQQLVKNIYLSQNRSYLRKLRELVLTLSLEQQVKKEKILETYLNVVEFGPGIYGIRDAAARYFGKAPEFLSPVESAYLAFLLPNPKVYSDENRLQSLTPFGRRMVRSILTKMVQAGYAPADALDSYYLAGS